MPHLPPAPLPVLEGPAGGGVVPTKAEVPARPGRRVDDLLELQKERVSRDPGNDDEKLRLVLLHAATGNVEESERVLSTVKSRSHRLLPYVDLFLKRELGEHREAAKVLEELVEADRRATGLGIERAVLCTKVRRYRDYTAAESEPVKPGGHVLIYVEPRNFTLQRSGESHILHLKYDWKLFDDRSTEHPVQDWEKAAPEEREDRGVYAGPVHEFYQSFRLPLPRNLAMGQYRIRVTVTDAHTGKSDRVFVPVSVKEAGR